jgi:ribonucleoside-diphosphate reductase alpha chain
MKEEMKGNVNNWKDITVLSKIEPELSKNGLLVLEKRYLAKDDEGNVKETAGDLFLRVAKYVASGDSIYSKDKKSINKTAEKFYELMASLSFLPNSPTLMNAGRSLGQLSACFVLPIEDSMDKIFDSVKNMALIHKSGGGTGFSFSRLRPKNDIVRSTSGISSGPVSFMNIFNAATETVKQGGNRRGANMAILDVTHPDILEFISAKENGESLTNFNISVALTDEFMKAVKENKDYDLINPKTKKKAGHLNAKEVYDLIVQKAWDNGEPGIVFIDKINQLNSIRKVGLVESTNPCGEQPLLPYESCNLGSINLNNILKEVNGETIIDYDLLRDITSTAVHFLDNVIDLNKYPLPEIEKATKENRKIGLGLMGFADLLIKMKVPYDSDRAIELAEKVMSVIQDESTKKSEKLAEERGAFPNFPLSTYSELGNPIIRNATTTTIAPTGTISIIADSSSGIEPIFALAYVKNVMDKDVLVETNSFFEKVAKEQGFFKSDIMDKVADHGSVSGIEEIPEEVRDIFVTAHDISPEWHIKVQAAFQKYTDNAVSKTVNFSNSATIEDIRKVYSMAYDLGCKGVTVYRDGSRSEQVLETKATAKENSEVSTVTSDQLKIHPRIRKDVTWGATRKMTTGCGALYVTINEDHDGLFEVFAVMGKSGGCSASQTEAMSRLITLSLRSGIAKDEIIKQLKGIRCPNQAWEAGGRIYSCSDAVAKAMERYSGLVTVDDQSDPSSGKGDVAEVDGKGYDKVMVGVCPECHAPLEFESGCSVCRSCGFSRCG